MNFFKIQYGQIYRQDYLRYSMSFESLKSNMDRFIGTSKKFFIPTTKSLKSNMDRFIGILKLYNDKTKLNFKIQYGQIYRPEKNGKKYPLGVFKIQYGQIYSLTNYYQRSGNMSLKSNMDRFIGEMGINDVENMQHFKIQYGQIYS